ncbi:unnamed protein product [Rotaria socialis]|uniref:Uncharacterized protein n=1 Tax=Rotaria socialis TaxID=392032 RepID=A0A818DGQ5_9BILA|nr:unnamed protein product [Rotaria socialis]CAF4759204.1 unnamed protein product [Rotaria socialis]
MKGTKFEKKKSKQAAEIVIVILLICIIGTSLFDPISRRLIEEENEDIERVWCIITFPPGLQVVNSFIQTFYFFTSFMIDLMSATTLITKKSRWETNLHVHRTYKDLLQEQLRQYQQLFATLQ